jgi:L-lactate dehydrogenase (cytochrome)
MDNTGLNLIPATADDYRTLARKRLPRMLFDYIDGGSYSERTLAANTRDFEELLVRQQVMRDVSNLDTSATMVGEDYAMPLVLAPIGLAGMMARRAEVQAIQVANKLGIQLCLSTVSICSLEEVAAASNRSFWFQLYMMHDRGYVEQLLKRAEEVGCTTLVFTVDLAVLGARYRDVRNGLNGPISTMGKLKKAYQILSHPGWLHDVAINGKPHVFGNLAEFVPNASQIDAFKEWIDNQFDASVTWKDIEWLRSKWKGKLIIKGVLDAEDARSAVKAGADGVVVSNHGGRQLDGVRSSIAVLPEIVEALAGKAEILIDGGVRGGQDIAKAVAMGANGTMIGRGWIWALAAQGTPGLTRYLEAMREELKVTLALTGCPNLRDLTPAIFDQTNNKANS